MSIAFREVLDDFDKVRFDNKCLTRTDTFHIGEKLLLSSNNMRPKSRSKSSLSSNSISKLLTQDSKLQDNGLKPQNPVLTSVNLLDSNSDLVKIQKEKHNVGSDEINNDFNNNAHNYPDTLNESQKKGKRSRKRTGASVKSKRGKHGHLLQTVEKHEKHSSLPSQQIFQNSQNLKSNRISSEQPSKGPQTSFLSNIRQDSDDGSAQNKVHRAPFSNVHNLCPIRVASAKTTSNSLPLSHYINDNLTFIPNTNNMNSSIGIGSLEQPVVIYKLEMNPRAKSATSSAGEKSEIGAENDKSNLTEGISINAVSCKLQHDNKSCKTVVKYQHKSSSQGLSQEGISKQAVLTSIYGAVYHTADKLSVQMEQFKKVKKIFLSEKQSGTIRENGMEFPCAPPATPTPDLMKKHEYIPCMSDIRSQRAVKSRLQEMEKEAVRKQEKRKEANVKLEKQQLKEKEKLIKVKQRREIYALNKVMTELENKRFLDFCQGKGSSEL